MRHALHELTAGPLRNRRVIDRGRAAATKSALKSALKSASPPAGVGQPFGLPSVIVPRKIPTVSASTATLPHTTPWHEQSTRPESSEAAVVLIVLFMQRHNPFRVVEYPTTSLAGQNFYYRTSRADHEKRFVAAIATRIKCAGVAPIAVANPPR
jgi:hypothetical protein